MGEISSVCLCCKPSHESFYFGDIFQGVMRIFRRISYNGQSQIRRKIRWQIRQNEIRQKIRIQNRRTYVILQVQRASIRIASRMVGPDKSLHMLYLGDSYTPRYNMPVSCCLLRRFTRSCFLHLSYKIFLPMHSWSRKKPFSCLVNPTPNEK